ncbi:MAG: DUF4388 domain-containing protein [Actinobacteria bacterium]|nr:MAG: DUF4388 domain-containing protein [Actinomycetota bacterium]
MGLQGNLSGFTLSEIFRMISFSSKTGQLVVARDSSEGRVYFRDGTVHFASTPDNRLPIGMRLVEAAIISREHLEQALTTQRAEPERRLGQILVSKGFVAQDVLSAFVREQIQDALFEIFEWEDGTYYFEPESGADEDIGVSLQVEEIVAEAERRRQEWDTIREVLPSIESPVRLSPNAVAMGEPIELEPQEWAAICAVSNGSRLTDLRSALRLSSLGVCRMTARLITRGVLELIPLPATTHELDSLPVVEGESLEEQLADYRRQGLLAKETPPPESPPIGSTPFEEATSGLFSAEYEQHEPAGEAKGYWAAYDEHAEESMTGGRGDGQTEEPAAERPAGEPGREPALEGRSEEGQGTEEAEAPAETASYPQPERSGGAVSAIRKYITQVSGRAGRYADQDYPVEWLTYYGRLQHNKAKGPSENELRSRVRPNS